MFINLQRQDAWSLHLLNSVHRPINPLSTRSNVFQCQSFLTLSGGSGVPALKSDVSVVTRYICFYAFCFFNFFFTFIVIFIFIFSCVCLYLATHFIHARLYKVPSVAILLFSKYLVLDHWWILCLKLVIQLASVVQCATHVCSCLPPMIYYS